MFTNCKKVQSQANCCKPSNSAGSVGVATASTTSPPSSSNPVPAIPPKSASNPTSTSAPTTKTKPVGKAAMGGMPSSSPTATGTVTAAAAASTATAAAGGSSGRRATIAGSGPSHEQRLPQQQLQQLFRNSKQETLQQCASVTSTTTTSSRSSSVTTSANPPNTSRSSISKSANASTDQVDCSSNSCRRIIAASDSSSSSSSSITRTQGIDKVSVGPSGRMIAAVAPSSRSGLHEVTTSSPAAPAVMKPEVQRQQSLSHSHVNPGAGASGLMNASAASSSSSSSILTPTPASSFPYPSGLASSAAAASVSTQPIGVVRGISKSPQPLPKKTPPISMANRGMSTDMFTRRPIYPNFPFSPFTSPGTSPYLGRRRQFRESQRVSVEQVGDTIQLNQYKLMHPIGQGSFGIVKLAYNEEDDQFYAMKILSKRKLLQKAGIFGRMAPSRKASGKTGIENPLTRVYREVAILKKLDHPNVVKLMEVLDDPTEDNLYLVFELLERGEVLEIPSTTPLPEDIAWKYFRDVVLGLEYLHYQKIIHRDIKPSNLLVSDDDKIKIADFGVCNEFNREDDAILTSTSGTPAFVAPEALAIPKGSYSGKMADIWQLGVTLYALIYGQIPFNDGNIMKLYDKIQHDEISFPRKPEGSPPLKDMLLKMLQKDPAKRITLPEIKVHDWVTKSGEDPLPTEEENCLSYVEVTDDDIMNCVRSIPKLDTLILVKTMLKNHSFQHPFKRGHSKGKNSLHVNGRSHSAPSSYNSFFEGKIMSLDSDLPIVSESAKESMASPMGSFVSKDPSGRNSYRKN